jgi:Tfp pilus assembly protein PilN
MPQQINLCSPTQRARQQIFSARTMLVSLAVFAVLGGTLCGVMVWNLQRSTAEFNRLAQGQTQEIEKLKAATDAVHAIAGPAGTALEAQLQAKRKELARREQLLVALQDGLLRPGLGHSDQLALVARSVPDPVWVTTVKADATRFEVGGFTLEPAALNAWVKRLSESPLLRGLDLSVVEVEHTTPSVTAAKEGATVASGAAQPQIWSFTLVNAYPNAEQAAQSGAVAGASPDKQAVLPPGLPVDLAMQLPSVAAMARQGRLAQPNSTVASGTKP